MQLKIRLLLAGFAVIGCSQLIAMDEDDAEIRNGTKKFNNLTVKNQFSACGNAAVGNLLAVGGNITYYSSGSVDALNVLGSLETAGVRVVFGSVTSGSTFVTNSGFSTVVSPVGGYFNLTFAKAFSTTPVVIATINQAAGPLIAVTNITTTGCTIQTTDINGIATSYAFNILALGR